MSFESTGLVAPETIAVPSREAKLRPLPVRILLSPDAITLLAAPVTVGLTMCLACLILRAAGIAIHGPEMGAAAIANTIAGVAASLPIFVLVRKGTMAIAQGAIMGIGIRIGVTLAGMLAATMLPMGLEKMILAYWVMAFYFPLLIVETTVVAWLSNTSPN